MVETESDDVWNKEPNPQLSGMIDDLVNIYGKQINEEYKPLDEDELRDQLYEIIC